MAVKQSDRPCKLTDVNYTGKWAEKESRPKVIFKPGKNNMAYNRAVRESIFTIMMGQTRHMSDK